MKPKLLSGNTMGMLGLTMSLLADVLIPAITCDV